MNEDIFKESILGKLDSDNRGAPKIVKHSSNSNNIPTDLTIYDFFPFTCLLLTKFLFIDKLSNNQVKTYFFYRDVYLLTHSKYVGSEFRIEITKFNFRSKIKLVNPYFISKNLIYYGLLNLKSSIENISFEVIPSVGSDKLTYKKEKFSQLDVLSKENVELFKPYLNKKLCFICPFSRRCTYGT